MSRRAIAKGTLITLIVAGLIVMPLRIAGLVAENAAEKKAIAAFEKLGGWITYRQENKPDLSTWIAWAWPDSTTVQHLYLVNTQVTDAGVAELRKALPECGITN